MSTQQVTNICTPTGRLVGGHPMEEKTEDYRGRPLTYKTGANAGQPRSEYYVGLAIAKTDPGVAQLFALIHAEAQKAFPHLALEQDIQSAANSPTFAWKITDGDSAQPNSSGRAPNSREGYPGHWIFNMAGSYAPTCHVANAQGQMEKIVDANEIKRGYYLRVYGSVRGNGSADQPGIFLNPSMIERVAFGQEIFVGPDANQVFGEQPASLPPGASATPLAPTQQMQQMQQPGAAAPAPQPVPQGQSAPTPAATPQGQVAPAQGFLNPGTAATPIPAPVPQGQPAPAPQTPKQYKTPDGGVYTYEQLQSAGWSDAQIQALPDNIPF